MVEEEEGFEGGSCVRGEMGKRGNGRDALLLSCNRKMATASSVCCNKGKCRFGGCGKGIKF